MDKIKLTKFSKVLLFIVFFALLSCITYGLFGIYHITDTSKLIVNNKLVLTNGWYWFKPHTVTVINDYPNDFDLHGILDLQLSKGEIYMCCFIVKSSIDEDWVLIHKKAPTINIPKYSLNSYLLDYVGTLTPNILFEAKTKSIIENKLKDWLILNTKNNGIIINSVKIHSQFLTIQEFTQYLNIHKEYNDR